jgi:large subunit ribosomal protein L4
MKLKVFTPDAASSVEKEFDGIPVFEGDKGLQAVKEVIVAINANNRQGTRSTKTRGEVAGSNKKPWNQKGTGRARAGEKRSPIWVGGGVVFGPRPRDFSKKINTKVKALAFSRALYDRCAAGEIDVIEKFDAPGSKTKEMQKVIRTIAPKGKVLVVDETFTIETARATRNLCSVEMQEASKLNTLDLAQYKKIIVSTAALEKIIARAKGATA